VLGRCRCRSALDLFNDYEGVVVREGSKMLPMDGTIHPLTAQVLSYIKVSEGQAWGGGGRGPSGARTTLWTL
jgi:hypothetical protein